MKGPRQVLWGLLAALLFLCIIFGSLTTAMVENNAAVGLRLTPTPSVTPSGSRLTIIPGASATASPSPTATCPIPVGWQAITVQPADSLDSLAQAYGVTAEALQEANCLVSPKLIPGTVFYVPARSSTSTSSPAPTVTIGQPGTPCGRPPGWVLYTVQSGDNLYRLSLAFEVSIYQLMQANCLPSTTIYTSQQLYVPNVPTRTPAISPTPSTTPTTPASATPTQTPTVPIVTTPALTPLVTVTPTATEGAPTATPTSTDEPTGAPTPSNTPTPTPTTTGGPYPR